MKIRSHAATMLLCAGTLCSVASAQVINWNNAGGGAWNAPTNWNPQNIPDSAAESAVIALPGTYSVSYNISALLGGLSIPNAAATVGVSNAAAMLFVGATMPVEGRLVVNAESGGSLTQIRFDASTLISGAGRLSLNANPNLDTAVLNTNGTTFTAGPGFTIDGTGKINGAMVNNGLVNANVAGRTLELTGSPKTNNATMRASGSGTLSFSSIGVTQNASGVIEASGGPVAMLNTSVSGGTVRGVGPSAVGLSGICAFTSVSASGQVGVNNAGSLVINGTGLANAGTLTLNVEAGGSGTQIRVDSNGSLSGPGVLVLNANPNVNTAVLNTNGTTLTHAAGHTIRGTGKINAVLVNNGEIAADVNGRTLELTAGAKTNNATMSAVGGGTLLINGIGVAQGAGGRIAADAGTASLFNATITGGLVESADASSPVTIGGTCGFTDVTLSGPAANINDGSILIVRGAGLNNTGTLTVNAQAGASATYIRFDQNGAFTGPGQVVLNANPNIDTAYLQTNGTQFTNASPHLIRGTGRIFGLMINDSEVRADRDGRVLELLSINKNNNGLLTAVNNATLSISGITVTQGPGGRILANAGRVSLFNATINSGRIESSDASSPVTIAGTCTFTDVNLSSPAAGINDGSILLVRGAGLNNAGTLTVNPQAGGSGTYIRFDQNGALTGAGQVVLNANPNPDTAYLQTNGTQFTNASPHLIRGTGRIYGLMVNDSEIRADRDGRVLELLSIPKANNGLLSAVNNATLAITGIAVTQGIDGRIVADGAAVSLLNATISGGRIESSNASSTVTISGSCTFNGVSLSGPNFVIPTGSNLFVAGQNTTLTNNATLTVNSNAGGSTAQIRFDAPGITVAGTGTIRLNANPNLDTAYMNFNGVPSVILGPGQRIVGRGRMYNGIYDIRGTLSPGFGAAPTDVIEFPNAAPRFAPTSALEIDVAGVGAGQFDRITSGRVAVLDGVVRVTRLGGFVASTCVSLPIMTTPAGNTGRFIRVEGDTGDPDRKWRLFNSGTQILLTSACLADFNADCTIDFNDLLEYLNLYNAQDPEADLDGDGVIDFNDFLAFLNIYTGGCA